MPFRVGQSLRLDHVNEKNIQICGDVTVTSIIKKNGTYEYYFNIDKLNVIPEYLEENNITSLPKSIITKVTTDWRLTNSQTIKSKSKFCHF